MEFFIRAPQDLPNPELKLATARLDLVAAQVDWVQADLVRLRGGPDELTARLGARVPEGWPPAILAEVLAEFVRVLQADPSLVGWSLWYWIRRAAPGTGPVLVGSGGFKGRPGPDGSVEIGYSMVEEFQGRGYATEAVRALTAWALAQPGVHQVVAETMPVNTGSLRVLEKLGFVRVEGATEPGALRFAVSALRG